MKLGWKWNPGARGDCYECRRWVIGLWRYFVSQTTATVVLCADCAGGTEA